MIGNIVVIPKSSKVDNVTIDTNASGEIEIKSPYDDQAITLYDEAITTNATNNYVFETGVYKKIKIRTLLTRTTSSASPIQIVRLNDVTSSSYVCNNFTYIGGISTINTTYTSIVGNTTTAFTMNATGTIMVDLDFELIGNKIVWNCSWYWGNYHIIGKGYLNTTETSINKFSFVTPTLTTGDIKIMGYKN